MMTWSLHLHHLAAALTMAILGAPFIGAGLSALADDMSMRMKIHELRSGMASRQLIRIQPRKQLAAIIGASAGLLLLANMSFGLGVQVLYSILFGAVLILLAVIDIKTGYLPDVLTMPLMVAGLVVNYWHIFASFTNACLGTAMGYFVIAASNVLHRRFRRQAGFGGGDAKMLAAIGAWVGLNAVMWVPALALVGPFVLTISRFVLRRHARITTEIPPAPFGPWLAAAGVAVMIMSSM